MLVLEASGRLFGPDLGSVKSINKIGLGVKISGEHPKSDHEFLRHGAEILRPRKGKSGALLCELHVIRVLVACVRLRGVELGTLLSINPVVFKHSVGVSGTLSQAFLIQTRSKVHYATVITDTVDLSCVLRTKTATKDRISVVGRPTVSIDAASRTLILSGTVTLFARVVA
jgi:hypothetical protein